MPVKYEDKYAEIMEMLRKRKLRWGKLLPHGMAWEDAEALISHHIYKKWHLYDQSKNFTNWASVVISNQIKNLCRNSYLSYAKPCFQCPHNLSCFGMEENHVQGKCSFTSSGTQDHECEDFANWSKTKSPVFKLRYPVSLEHFGEEISNNYPDFDMDESLSYIKTRMSELLPPKQYDMFIMLHFENVDEDEVAIKAGYQTNEVGRKPGYARMAALKKKFKEMVQQIIKEMSHEED